jgi:hypothetical protein
MAANGAATLMSALAWRSRREGIRYLLLPLALFAFVLLVLFLITLPDSGQGVNGAQELGTFGERYGAHADSIVIGVALLIGPGLVAVFGSFAVLQLVRNVIGGESSSGGIEALLAAPYRPRNIMVALLGFAAVAAAGSWAAMTAMLALAVALIAWTAGTSVSLTASYLLAALLVPLLSALCATSLAVGVNLLFPRLSRTGSYGLNMGGGGIGYLPAVVPGIAVMLVFSLWGAHVGLLELLAVAGGSTGAVTVVTVAMVAAWFSPDAVLES